MKFLNDIKDAKSKTNFDYNFIRQAKTVVKQKSYQNCI
jgi:hypothetical protein